MAWVEVIDKNAADTTATYYSYDVHGNVKSLLQHVPGLGNKRTDYLYDLVSGKVNYVFYQYGKPDQFVHKYQYDADNRLISVFTSTDRFMWNQEASYYYYKHGPLARVELGAYRSQGQDYYYTLQGWIKGVNQPYGDQNAYDNNVGKDVYAYALGYYENDYKPINSSLTTTDTRDQLWTRLNETHNHKGLYNGNISWMVTDLTKIGEVTNDRSKGIQAMLYKYDQLHRITKSRSLTSYAEGTGFAARTATPAPYDETYTDDANGNILTLNRMNGEGVLLDDFNYKYYGGTNKLRGVKPITRDTLFNGTVNSPDKLYRNITLQGGALAANGNSATLKATELVAMNPSFAAEEGTDFAAYIPEDGPYIYDAIGNLVADEDEGVKISWTPYGKIREVKTKNDSVTVKFRYDGTGNRIEKRVEKYDTTLITRYVRDASGNVMTIYNDTTVSEQPIYGSARLGMYKGSVQDGHQTLGRRSYELSNHLGNVLAVITDNIGMNTQDTVWASVESSSDYYAFGMGMPGRSYSSANYRYGFNGKEKDDKGELGETNYDYGFRIYNPKIAKFLSVDPLTMGFPELTPYQYASNTPIFAIDLDGLEAKIATYGTDEDLRGEGQFKREAERDVKLQIASSTEPAFSGKMLLNLMKDYTKAEGSIEYLSIYSHGYSEGATLNYRPNDRGNGSWFTMGNSKVSEGSSNENIAGVVRGINSGEIKFTNNSIVIFAGCNMAREISMHGKSVPEPLAESFTKYTHVASIGADGYTMPDIENDRRADYSYYLFFYNSQNKMVEKHSLGKELNLESKNLAIDYVNARTNTLEKIEPKGIDSK